MPLLFQACTPRGDKQRRMVCCLNNDRTDHGDALSTPACPPCGRCHFIKDDRTRCRNTSCWVDMCHIHLAKVYGVRLAVDPHGGRRLMTTRKFKAGDLIAPMGGVPVEDENGEPLENDWLPGKEITGPYSYDMVAAKNVVLHRQPGQRGFVDRDVPRAASAAPQWPRARPNARDTFLRVALVVPLRRRGTARLYLVHTDDWPAFEAALAARVRSGAISRRAVEQARGPGDRVLKDRLGIPDAAPLPRARDTRVDTLPFVSLVTAPWNLTSFEAYVDVELYSVEMDAACWREAGSYANDPARVRFEPGKRGLDNTRVLNANLDQVNAYISDIMPLPLNPNKMSWLLATKDIDAKSEVLVAYGEKQYWGGLHVRHKTYPVQTNRGGARRQGATKCTLRN